jgi:1-deoxy-D-xylulose-5-phosphate reductoisomerase
MDQIKIAVIGSTGSIGRQTLEIVRAHPQSFRIVALAAGTNTELLAAQLAEFTPDYACWQSDAAPPELPAGCRRLPLKEIAALPDADRVVLAAGGFAGLEPTLAAVSAGKTVCQANKEAIVCAGELIKRRAAASGARLLPVDSEHSAVWQCLENDNRALARVWLTASGGPFRGRTRSELEHVDAAAALAHPSWNMGPKVTIDSATLVNKGLEIIEAHWLFDVDYDRIGVVVHPQSIVHSMVEFGDGSLKAQLSRPDMRYPIQYALTYPERLDSPELPRLDWKDALQLDFSAPDAANFPGLKIAVEAGRRGGTYPAVLCGADEAAVALFLEGKLSFTGITDMIEEALTRHRSESGEPDIEDVLAADQWARSEVTKLALEARP